MVTVIMSFSAAENPHRLVDDQEGHETDENSHSKDCVAIFFKKNKVDLPVSLSQ